MQFNRGNKTQPQHSTSLETITGVAEGVLAGGRQSRAWSGWLDKERCNDATAWERLQSGGMTCDCIYTSLRREEMLPRGFGIQAETEGCIGISHNGVAEVVEVAEVRRLVCGARQGSARRAFLTGNVQGPGNKKEPTGCRVKSFSVWLETIKIINKYLVN